MSDSKMTGMLTCPDCKVIHPLGGCAEYLREKRLASAMTELLGDFSFSEHVAAKLSTLLSEKYTNSQKIVAGIIKQEIEAVFREVDAEGRTAAAESREEPVSKKKCSVCGGERTQLNREGTQFGACKSARCEFPLLDYDNEQREFAARQPGESPT